jgi:flagellin-specific chaperone FliS
MHASEDDTNPYLQQEVLTASPIRLRWLLIQRAEELCRLVSLLWSEGKYETGQQWLLRIRDILGELLEGVRDASNPLSGQVCDFYIFLLRLTAEVESTRDPERLGVMKDLLAYEAETWRQLLEKLGETSMQTDDRQSPAAALNQALASFGSADCLTTSSFSLEV